jgi:hypothetical protein
MEETNHQPDAPEPIATLGTPAPASTPRPAIVEVDPDEDLGFSSDARTTQLDAIKEELVEELPDEDAWIDVPRRKRFSLGFKTTLEGELLAKWIKASKDRKSLTGVNELGLALRVLANQNTAIRHDGNLVTEAGIPLTVRHQPFLELMGVGRPFDAVTKLFASDGHVLAAAQEVLAACGYGEDLSSTIEDPTPRP